MSKRNVVVVGGIRTPFVKAFAEYLKMDTIALGTTATKALIKKTGIPTNEIEKIVFQNSQLEIFTS